MYEKTLELWLREREMKDLCEIPESFVEELSKYASTLRRQIRLSDRSSLSSALKSAELDMVQAIVESLLEMRFRKIIMMSIDDRQPDNMLSFEKKTFYGLQRIMSEHRERIKSISHELRMPYSDSEPKYDVVSFLQPFPKVVGEDLRSYGPFKPGDIAALPPANARSLARRNIVRRVIFT